MEHHELRKKKENEQGREASLVTGKKKKKNRGE